jgi:hypothetical protein
MMKTFAILISFPILTTQVLGFTVRVTPDTNFKMKPLKVVTTGELEAMIGRQRGGNFAQPIIRSEQENKAEDSCEYWFDSRIHTLGNM